MDISRRSDVWLEAAHSLLAGGDRYGQAAAAILATYQQDRQKWRTADRTFGKHLDLRGIITFDNPFFGSTAPYLKRILMSPTALKSEPGTPFFARQVAVLAHELWHTQQRRLERYSVWGELEAHNFEIRVRSELGAAPKSNISPENQAAILALGDPLGTPIPRERKLLKSGRSYLPDYWVYQREPLYFWRGIVPVY